MVMAIIFFAEIVSMFILRKLFSFHFELNHIILDSSVMMILSTPFLLWLIIKLKHGEDTLLQEKNRLDIVTGYANCGMFLLDTQARITYANNIAEKWFGPFHQIGGKFCWEIYKLKEPEKDCASLEALQTGETAHREISIQLENGDQKVFYVVASPVKDNIGKILQINEIVIDITERKLAVEALKKSETSLKKAQEMGKIGSWEFDLKTQKINWSDQVYVLYERDKKLGPPSVEEEAQYYLPEVVKKLHELVRMATETGKEYRYDLTVRLPSGRIDFFNTSIVPVKDEKGNVIQLWGTIQDITERRKAEETRIENLRLEAADKAKSEFLANMSHELRTPLNAIIGFSDVLSLEIGGSLNEKQKDYVNDIHNAGEHLLLIINDILDLSKVEAGEMDLVLEKFTVNELLEETITFIKNKAIKHHINIIRDIDPQLEFMEGDKTKIKQVLFNLLSNAVKFSGEEGGTLTIKAKKEGDMVQISVSDTGIGIKEENVGKLFHKFEQLESGITRKYGGTGLGLAITKQLVELHGGRIWAESIYGEGSKFTFLIPIQKEVD